MKTDIDPAYLLRMRLNGLSQAELARQIGVSRQLLNMVIKGQRSPGPKVLKFLGIRRAYEFVERRA